MKKNLLFRLCLILMVAITIYSCRTDQFPEKETYDNSSAFQLTAKTIYLEQSKDKEKLSSVISNAGSDLKKLDDGITVDTGHVVYIENGPDYHTYTFRIIRENASENAPLENLVLSPLTDGTYRKLLFTYHLTPQEKQTLIDGGDVDTKGKITITDLGGNFSLPSGGSINKYTNCQWVQVTTYTICSEGIHGGGKTQGCTAAVKSVKLTTSIFLCDPDAGEGNPGGPELENPTPPTGGGCSPNGVLTGPQAPNDGMGMVPCGGGIPTLPNLSPQTPCEKIEMQRTDTDFNNRITDLEGKTGLTKETGYIQKWGGSYEYKDNASATDDANALSLPEVASNTYIKAYMHTHIDDKPNSDKKGIKMFSPADVVYFMNLIQNAQTRGFSLSDPYAVMVTSIGNYQIRFTGNQYQIKTFTDQEKEYHREPFSRGMEKYLKNPKQLEFRFLKYIQKEMLLYGITLYRMNTDGTTTEIKLNADKTDTVENNCTN